MTRRHRAKPVTDRVVLLVDDDPDYLEATRILLEGEGHQVLTADRGSTALQLARERDVDLVLLDYFMPGMTGEEVVSRLREFEPYVHIILQTGFSDDQPPREMVRRLDIQGYYDKSEGPEKLLLWTDASLKSVTTTGRLARTTHGIQQLVELAAKLQACSTEKQLLTMVAGQVGELARTLRARRQHVVPSEDTPPPPSIVALLDADGRLDARYVVGTPSAPAITQHPLRELLQAAAEQGQVLCDSDATAVPLRVGTANFGAVGVAHPLVEESLDLVRLLVDQAAVALQLLRYRSAATRTTGALDAASFARCLIQEVRASLRFCRPLSLVALEIPRKGPRRGQTVERVVLAAQRPGRPDDVLGRSSGAYLWLLLPHTAARAAHRVACRLTRAAGRDIAAVGVASLDTHRFPPRSWPALNRERATRLANTLQERATGARISTAPSAGIPVRIASPITWSEVIVLAADVGE